MTRQAVKSLEADHATIASLCGALPPEAWDAPTGCEGWAVRDVIAHMTQLFRMVVDPGSLPAADPSGSSERTNDRQVEAIRDDDPHDLLRQYTTLGEQTIAALAGAQDDTTPIDLGDLGTHPLHLIANAYAFDHLVHLHADLAAPNGPITTDVAGPSDDQIEAALDWMFAGLPTMNEHTLAWLDSTVEVRLTGPAARTCQVTGADGRLTVHPGSSAAPAATVTSPTTDFLWWATARTKWSDLDVDLDGDAELARRFCDDLHIY